MNLLAKRAGLVLTAAVLFLVSCEDDSFLLGIKGKTKFQGRYQEITFTDVNKKSVLLLDSVYTDQYEVSASPVDPYAYRFLIGSYEDPNPAFGTVKAGFYAQYLPNASPSSPAYFNPNKIDVANLQLDSTTIQLLLDFYAYGPEVTIDDAVDVYPLIEDHPDSLTFYKRYINTSALAYTPTPVGQLRIKKFSRKYSGSSKFRPYELTNTRYEEQVDRSSINRDTIMLQGALEPEFSFRIFSWIASHGDSALVSDELLSQFRKKFPGLAFVSTKTGRVIGINPINGFSRFTFHYQDKTVAKDSLTTALYFSPFPYVGANGFSNIATTRAGDLNGIDTYPPHTPFDPGPEKLYIQDGSAVVTEFDLSDYYSFIDTLQDIVINSAEISMEVEAPPVGMPPPPALYSLLMKKTSDNKIVPLNLGVEEDSLKWRHYVGNTFTDLRNLAIPTELSNASPLTLTYDNTKNRYVGYATLFFQALFNGKDRTEFHIERLGFYPASAPILKLVTNYLGQAVTLPLVKSGTGNTVNRAVLKTSGIKLKLYYTVPNKPNLE